MRQTSSSDELLPCSGCGNADIQIERKEYQFFAICKKCGRSGETYPVRIQAYRSWNKKNRQKGDCANE